MIVAEAHHRKSTVQGDSLTCCINELLIVHNEFRRVDPFTCEPLELGFVRKILMMPKQNINMALYALTRQASDPKDFLHTRTAYDYLKAACAPF